MYLQTPVKLTATWPSSFRFAPEVVCHGVTGFVVSTLEEMMDANGQVNQIELRRCREYCNSASMCLEGRAITCRPTSGSWKRKASIAPEPIQATIALSPA